MAAAASPRGRALLAWFEQNSRRLPWRGCRDPYAVLVSEVMLQQTQASRVARSYPAFLERFPNAYSLAEAELSDVLAAWSGLGYNRRARRLWESARVVAREGWPTTVAGLARLPGVGAYTAAAVGCFGLGLPVPAVDTNMRRVLSRWMGRPLTGGELPRVAAAELTGDAADWNQAVMDLGSTVCTARNPRCRECPVAQWCAGPDVRLATSGQEKFEGSNRQVRGAVMRALLGEAPSPWVFWPKERDSPLTGSNWPSPASSGIAWSRPGHSVTPSPTSKSAPGGASAATWARDPRRTAMRRQPKSQETTRVSRSPDRAGQSSAACIRKR